MKKRKANGKVKKIPAILYNEDERDDDGGEWVVEITKINEGAGAGFAPISIDGFIEAHKKNNPGEDMKSYRAALEQAAEAKKSGAVCAQCGSPIWAIGTATVGWNGCFTCITGEADCSEDYEIDSVCF